MIVGAILAGEPRQFEEAGRGGFGACLCRCGAAGVVRFGDRIHAFGCAVWQRLLLGRAWRRGEIVEIDGRGIAGVIVFGGGIRQATEKFIRAGALPVAGQIEQAGRFAGLADQIITAYPVTLGLLMHRKRSILAGLADEDPDAIGQRSRRAFVSAFECGQGVGGGAVVIDFGGLRAPAS